MFCEVIRGCYCGCLAFVGQKGLAIQYSSNCFVLLSPTAIKSITVVDRLYFDEVDVFGSCIKPSLYNLFVALIDGNSFLLECDYNFLIKLNKQFCIRF